MLWRYHPIPGVSTLLFLESSRSKPANPSPDLRLSYWEPIPTHRPPESDTFLDGATEPRPDGTPTAKLISAQRLGGFRVVPCWAITSNQSVAIAFDRCWPQIREAQISQGFHPITALFTSWSNWRFWKYVISKKCIVPRHIPGKSFHNCQQM